MVKIEERRSKELASGCFHFERFFFIFEKCLYFTNISAFEEI